jgi:tetratricopeptide (TPR) repeat protein
MMTKYLNKMLFFVLLLSVALFNAGCQEESDDIPTAFDNVQQFQQEAWDFYNAGDYEAAIVSFDEVLEREGGNLDAKSGKAWSYFHLGSLDNAASGFQEVASGARLTGDDAILADSYAGLFFVYMKYKLEAELAGEAESVLIGYTIDGLEKYYQLLLATDENYQHRYEPDLFNFESIAKQQVKAYFSIQYFYKALLAIEHLDAGFTTAALLGAIGAEAATDTFYTANVEEGQVFLNWTAMDVASLDNITNFDLPGSDNKAYLVSGSQVLFKDSDFDFYSEQVTAQDSVIGGDSLIVIIPSQSKVYELVDVLDQQMAPAAAEEVTFTDDDDNEFINYIIVPDAGVYTVSYRFNVQLEVQYKTTGDFFGYLDQIAEKMFNL